MIRAAAFGAACLCAAACKPEPPADWAADLQAFRTAYEASLVSATGPRTAIAGHYVDPGSALHLRLTDAGVERTDEPAQASLSVSVDDGGMHCDRGCGAAAVSIDERLEIDIGSHHVILSPQSGTLRILVHGPKAMGDDVQWFAPDAAFWVQARLEPTPDAAPQTLATTRGLTKPMTPVGTLRFSLGGEAAELTAYAAGEGKALVPFADPTNGEDTYAVGRYLEAEIGDGPVTLDFNRATNPWCAYSEHYNCPVPPADNVVPVAVRAGEKSAH